MGGWYVAVVGGAGGRGAPGREWGGFQLPAISSNLLSDVDRGMTKLCIDGNTVSLSFYSYYNMKKAVA